MSANQSNSNGTSLVLSPATKKEIAKRLYVLAEALGETLTENRIDIYLQALSDLPPQPLLGILSSMVSKQKWFPKIPELREAVVGRPEDQPTLDAERAWENVQRVFSRYWWNEDTQQLVPLYAIGRRHDPPRLDATTEYALRQVGYWNAVAACAPEDVHFQRRDFISAYVRWTQTNGLNRLPQTFDQCAPQISEKMKGLLNCWRELWPSLDANQRERVKKVLEQRKKQ